MKFGAIFDLDGTLVDSPLDFSEIRRALGLDSDNDILEQIEAGSKEQREWRKKKLCSLEQEAAYRSEIITGVPEFFGWLESKKVLTAIFTRNSKSVAQYCLTKHNLRCDLLVAREDAPPKPLPDGLHLIASHWGIGTSRLAYFGDYKFDLLAGKSAGIKTYLYCPSLQLPDFADLAESVYSDYDQAKEIVERLIQ